MAQRTRRVSPLNSPLASRRQTKRKSNDCKNCLLHPVRFLESIPISAILFSVFLFCLWIISTRDLVYIDFPAYVIQVDQFLSGDRNYYDFTTPQGPLVYPAGFLYFFTPIMYLMNGGTVIWIGQLIFVGLYLATAFLSIKNGVLAGVPKWILYAVFLSPRALSIYILRLFNDGPTALLSQLCVFFFLKRNWKFGCVFLSLAVSMKMNALLYAPGVAFLLFKNLSINSALSHIVFICGGIQILLGYPFLVTYPLAYIHRAFELTRICDIAGTVNWKFLPFEVFNSRIFHVSLLIGTVLTYYCFWTGVWSKKRNVDQKSSVFSISSPRNTETISPLAASDEDYFQETKAILMILYSSNFIGVVFARSINTQYYVWYSFTLPVLVYFSKWTRTEFPSFESRSLTSDKNTLGTLPSDLLDWILRLLHLFGIEYLYNSHRSDGEMYPKMSVLFQVAHISLLYGVYRGLSELQSPKLVRGFFSGR